MQSEDHRQGEFEKDLGQILQARWSSAHADRAAIAKRLILSQRQLNALVQADPTAFHTYGIYLRALRMALQQAGVLQDAEVVERLEFLAERYLRNRHVSGILEVKRTVNRKLGVAPREPGAEKQTDARGVVALVVVVTVVLVLSVYVGLST